MESSKKFFASARNSLFKFTTNKQQPQLEHASKQQAATTVLTQDMTKIIKKQISKQALDDISELKRNLQGKPSKQETIKQKFNKTTIAKITNKKQKREDQIDHVEEYKMIVTMAVSKKKENYMQLKRWDEKRSEELGLHRNIIEQITGELDKRIKASIQNLEIYINFFKQKAKQQEKYASYPVIDARQATQNNPIAKNIYINCTSLLNLLNDESQNKSKKILNFAATLRKHIVKDRLQEHSNKSQSILLKIRQKISNFKSSLQKNNLETQNKSKKLAQYYNAQALNISSFNSQKDFFKSQLSFLRKALQQTNIQKQLGEYVLEYLKASIVEEEKRVNLLKQSFKQAYDYDQKQDYTQLKSAEEKELISQFYTLQVLLNPRISKLLKEKTKTSPDVQLNLEILEKYLQKFQFKEFDTRILLLKEYYVTHQISKQKSENCYLVITVDGFLHFFYNRQQHTPVYSKPNFTLKIDQSLKLKNISDIKLELKKRQEKKNGMMSYLIWDSKAQSAVTIRFSKKDTKEEFQDFIKKMI